MGGKEGKSLILLGLLVLIFSLIVFCGCARKTFSSIFSSGRQSESKSKSPIKPSGSQKGPAPTAYSTGYNGSASIQFEPYKPVDLNENAGFYDGTAGGISFYYLPLKQIVWGYRVYLYFSNDADVSKYINLNLWKKDLGESGVYYRDFNAQYRPAGNSFTRFYQPDPQTVVVDNIKPGYSYEYKILPLCITAKAPFNLDRNQKPFWYGYIPGPSLSFIWVDQKTKDWGAVMRDGGEANRGYYLVFYEVKNGMFWASSSSGGGGGGGGLHQ